MAAAYHQLGIVAQQRGQLDDAQRWYERSLEIEEEFGNRPGMASSYHQLGSLAQMRGQLDDAQRWYERSLEIKEQRGDRPGMASSYGQIGLLAKAKGDLRGALHWIVKCVALFEEFPHPAMGPGPSHLVRLTQDVGGITELGKIWVEATGNALPPQVRSFVEDELKGESG